jgi:hypothetical protein
MPCILCGLFGVETCRSCGCAWACHHLGICLVWIGIPDPFVKIKIHRFSPISHAGRKYVR